MDIGSSHQIVIVVSTTPVYPQGMLKDMYVCYHWYTTMYRHRDTLPFLDKIMYQKKKKGKKAHAQALSWELRG